MAMLSSTISTALRPHKFLLPETRTSSCAVTTTNTFRCYSSARSSRTKGVLLSISSIEVKNDELYKQEIEETSLLEMKQHNGGETETFMYSFAPFPLLFLAALPGAGAVRSLFGPFVEIVKSFDLPGWLVHWGHPGNMAVVLFAMGGYGTYLGFRIRYSNDVEEKAKAKDLHPKLLAGMFFFFALGATGGVTALLTSDKPIFESPHAVTGLIGLSLLTIQTILPSLFGGNPGLRSVHGILGSGIMTLFVIHAALGLQLGFSF
ncbi:translation initiation factor [Thalictrum thalictroides]|uniref:Translation initiation factor n=1 Tax=Thalictrum thalictroides TaxID=46969 RepID=A0A7J6UXP9_THATH|nr:translation initiation factor [Thalictrum thalictroides]